MAFASVISLTNTIERLLNSSRVLLVPPSPELIEPAYNAVKSLQEILKRLDGSSKSNSRKKVNALDGRIREAVSEFEDLLESHISNQIASQSEERNGGESHPLLLSIDLQQNVDSFTKKVTELKEEYIKELDNPLPEEEDDGDETLSSRSLDFGGKKSKLVGLSDDLRAIRYELTEAEGSHVIALQGMAGIGKTTLATEIFEDPHILKFFDSCVWVTVGRKSQLKEIQRAILAGVDPEADKMLMEGDEKTAHYLKESLKGKRCLIILDDVWEAKFWIQLASSFPDNDDGTIRILLTTRQGEVYEQDIPGYWIDFYIIMRLLNKEESWDLFHEKVFGEERCPSELVKVGQKIAENCDGLSLTIVKVADLLSKVEKTPEYWNMVAEKQSSIFMDVYDEISKVLYPSYDYLPQHLKYCFLYMGVFPQNYEIPLSEITNMWFVEGFLKPNITQTLEDCVEEYLVELVSRSLVILQERIPTVYHCIQNNPIKSCRLQSSFWYLCSKEARKNKFFHVLNNRVDGLKEGMKSQRRLCIHNNLLFGIKDMSKSMEGNCASTARSLLCFGFYHQYSVPMCFSLKLLRVLDALKIRFYEFPMEVLKLVQLRYLALTYNGKLPSSISKLWNLQFLIIHQPLSIKSCGAPSYVPTEIWDMQELRHIQITGSNLQNPTFGAFLRNLLTLLDVSARSCTKGVIKRISNIKKLGVQIELVLDDDSKSLRGLNRISRLRKLETLKCVIVNPELRSEIVAPPAPLSMFPSSLRKLHLSGFGYPWENMNIIASLPNLKVLKLRCYAFQGPKWEVEENRFLKLLFLEIEDTDLVQWKVGHKSFPELKYLGIKQCYKLKELHWESDAFVGLIKLVDNSPSFVNQIKSRRHLFHYVAVHSSWDDGNFKS